MSGGLFVNALLRETGHRVTAEEVELVQRRHAETYLLQVKQFAPCQARATCWITSQSQGFRGLSRPIATSGRQETAGPAMEALRLKPGVPVITQDQVSYAKPDPDLFLAAAERLRVPISASVVVGGSVWDLLAARRARALGMGLLSGGYGHDELQLAGAYRAVAAGWFNREGNSPSWRALFCPRVRCRIRARHYPDALGGPEIGREAARPRHTQRSPEAHGVPG
jgi:phosphoglycolate phosphatase-like HAD superfamily hydrolase